ncbi:hypothetical protein MGEO_19985 [Marivita geojedonensis]|uniref:Uncharacterized protein n=1 Tax=Marivita geojedonensis TaxID=1123756 RepID=A0A1X4N9F7_9RHOB|nr:hypothetical protein MGEO_19985 [Marivita geojedonensis]
MLPIDLSGVASKYAWPEYEVTIQAFFDRHQKDVVVPFSQNPQGRAVMLDVDADARAVSEELGLSRAGGLRSLWP